MRFAASPPPHSNFRGWLSLSQGHNDPALPRLTTELASCSVLEDGQRDQRRYGNRGRGPWVQHGTEQDNEGCQYGEVAFCPLGHAAPPSLTCGQAPRCSGPGNAEVGP